MRSVILRLSVMASESISVSMAIRSGENDGFGSGLQGVTKMPISDHAYRSGVAPRSVQRKFKRSFVRVRSSSFSIRCSTRWNIWTFALKKSCRICKRILTTENASFDKLRMIGVIKCCNLFSVRFELVEGRGDKFPSGIKYHENSYRDRFGWRW